MDYNDEGKLSMRKQIRKLQYTEQSKYETQSQDMRTLK